MIDVLACALDSQSISSLEHIDAGPDGRVLMGRRQLPEIPTIPKFACLARNRPKFLGPTFSNRSILDLTLAH